MISFFPAPAVAENDKSTPPTTASLPNETSKSVANAEMNTFTKDTMRTNRFLMMLSVNTRKHDTAKTAKPRMDETISMCTVLLPFAAFGANNSPNGPDALSYE